MAPVEEPATRLSEPDRRSEPQQPLAMMPLGGISEELPFPTEAIPLIAEAHATNGMPLGAPHRSATTGLVSFDTCLTRDLLDFQNRQTDKELFLLSHTPTQGTYPEVLVGGQLRASFIAAGTNREGKFPYLGRFPTDFVGDSATDARLLQANAHMTGHFTPYAHGYAEILFSDVFTFPSFEQGSLQMRQAFVTLGDLQTTPWYLVAGKKNVPFGDMGTLSPFSQSVVWHYFGGLAEGAGGGYRAGPWHLSAMALNGGRGIRVVDSSSIGQLNNFAASGTWSQCLRQGGWLQVGGSYLHGTIYDASVAEHIDPTQFGSRNPAWNANARYHRGLWQFACEFASTLDPWPTTNEKVIAWKTETARRVQVGCIPGRLSASFSEGVQGPGGSEFEFNRQFVLGLGLYPNSNAAMTFEYVHSSGFAPLIDITTVSDRDVHQHSFVMGLVLNL